MNETEIVIIINGLEKALQECLSSCEELRIESESSYSESVIIGSRKAYIRVAIEFLKLASLGPAASPVEIKSLFSEFGAVWPVSAYVTDNHSDAQSLAADFAGE